MRNLKKLLAVIMTVAMIASLMVPVLAADYDDDAQKLYKLGLFKGISETSYQPDLEGTLIRETGLALMIRAAGLEDEVLAMSTAEVNEQLAKVVDADEIADWAKPYVAYAVKNELTHGIDASILPNVKFGAKLNLSGKEFVTFMLKAMGYSDVAWDDVLSKAAEVGMLNASDAVKFGTIDVLSRDGAVGVMASAMGGTTAAGITLAQALVQAGAVTEEAMVEAGYMEPPAPPEPTPAPKFEVESIVADNLKVVKINLTRPVDKDTVNRTNVKVLKDSENIIVNDSDIKVSEDQKTLYVVVKEVPQNQKVKVALKDVKDTGGEKIEASETEIYMQDLTVPEILSFTANDAKTLEIAFSEPINYIKQYDTNLSNIKIDDKAVIGKTSFDYIKNTMTISLVNKLAEGTHKISIKDMKDYSGLVAIAKDFDFEIVKDETPPEIVSAKFVSTTQIDVEFNETIPDNKLGSFKVNGKEVTNKTKDGTKKIKLSGGFTLDMGALIEIKVEYKDQEDVVGNKVSDWKTYTFNIEDDTTLPDVSLEVKSDGKLKFTFTKAMNTAKGKITIKKKSDNSVVQTVTAPFTTGISEWKDKDKNREVEITFNNLKNKDAADYIAVLEEFEDATVRKNGMGKKEIEFAGKDTKAPEVFGYAKIAAASGDEKATITFFFSEEMDEDSLKNLSNYVVKSGDTDNVDKPFSAISGRDISIKEIKDSGKSIVIYYKDAEKYFTDADTDPTYFIVMGVKDKAGNYAATTEVKKYTKTSMSLDEASGPAVATAKNKIEVYFTTPVKEADPSAFVVKVGEEKIYFNDYKIDNKDGKGKVVFTLSKDLPTTAAANYKIAVDEVTGVIKDIYGNKYDAAKGTERVIVDKVKPYVKDIKEVAGKKLEITVSEIVYTDDIASLTNSMIIKDKDGNIIKAVTGKDAPGAKEVLVNLYKDSTNNPSTFTDGFNLIVLTFADDYKYQNVSVEFINRDVIDGSPDKNVIEAKEKTPKSVKVE